MRTFFNHTWRVIVATILLFILWGFSMSISESIIPSGLKMPDAPEAAPFYPGGRSNER